MIGLLAVATRPAAKVHVTVCPTTLHDQPVPVPDTKLSPAGKMSVTTGDTASDGPALWTASV